MIITRTPNRISYIGGGSDIKAFSSLYGGMVLGTAINKYSYLSVRKLEPFHKFKTRVVYSHIEEVSANSAIEHEIVRESIKYYGLENEGLEITHMSDLPTGTGVGSSSTFTVGLLNALAALQHKLKLPNELTNDSIFIERELLKHAGGYQDQVWAAWGGLHVLKFKTNGEISVECLPLSKQQIGELANHTMMFFTGETRKSSDVAKSYSELEKTQENFALVRLAEEGCGALLDSNYSKFGELIDKSWQIKSHLSSSVTNHQINNGYLTARLAGAYGGKLMGSGGGGCFLLIADPDKQEKIKCRLKDFGWLYIPVEINTEGSKIIFSGE